MLIFVGCFVVQAVLAKNAGFCSGVKRAFEIANTSLTDETNWHCLGPLVHNDLVIEYFENLGLSTIENLEGISSENNGVIIRSHGVSPDIIKTAEDKSLVIKDATCPLVKRVHDIVVELVKEEYSIVIYGANSHPEVKGILGWCGNKATVIETFDDANNYPRQKKIALVSQTTRDEKDFFAVANILLSKASEVRVFNTICSATRKRQEAARNLAKEVELMLVIGDKKSSNTTTLFNECVETGVKTYLIQNMSDIEDKWLKGVSKIGITAGASTPDWIIKEVFDRMTDYEENENQDQATNLETEDQATNLETEDQETNLETEDQVTELETEEQETNLETEDQVTEPETQLENNEESFAKLEAEMAGMESPGRGDVIKGTVIQVLDDEVMVDVGGKSEGVIPRREISTTDVESCKEEVNVGDEIEVLVLKWDSDGTILLSKKKVDSLKVLDKLEEDYKANGLISGTVVDVVKGGLLVDVGIIAFLPASHVDVGYVKDLGEYKGKTFDFKIIEFNRNKRRGSQIVISRKEIVEAEKAKLREEFWNSIEEGQTRQGRVKRIVDYGAFIDLGGYEGLLHVSELEHRRVNHPSDILTEGEDLEVFILGIDNEKQRVSLSRKALLKSPWETIIENNFEGDIIEGTVVRIAPFGAFIELVPGVDGLVHISQLADYRVEKPEDVVQVGDKISVKIISLDLEEKKIGLSLKQVSEDVEEQEIQEYLDNQDSEEDYE
ncbi:MAG TPA: bifunctional 4-hydroxy-3-methylbut-2-enyl diphosphate reductase/30S ribosomal protein S1 [Syntrophomonadaceae bacterium]|nr:bifunctional 4-hydroxy-3-methylbut-2-enyl diphosphate reductase/30S ribosomal protein S1 [Syntrophomonadaceae bacterium]